MNAEDRAKEISDAIERQLFCEIPGALRAGIVNDIKAAETKAHNAAIRAFAGEIANLVDGPSSADQAIRKMAAEIGLRLIKGQP